MKRFLLALIVVIAGSIAAGCAVPPYDPGSAELHDSAKKVVMVSYVGRDLYCLEQVVGHGGIAYACDFEAYYNEPPKHGSQFEVAHMELVDMPYRGRMLHCFKFDAGSGFSGYTCDFPRFYSENQNADLPQPRN